MKGMTDLSWEIRNSFELKNSHTWIYVGPQTPLKL